MSLIRQVSPVQQGTTFGSPAPLTHWVYWVPQGPWQSKHCLGYARNFRTAFRKARKLTAKYGVDQFRVYPTDQAPSVCSYRNSWGRVSHSLSIPRDCSVYSPHLTARR
jgi:hypothetical protein